jgi:hypothetical protein
MFRSFQLAAVDLCAVFGSDPMALKPDKSQYRHIGYYFDFTCGQSSLSSDPLIARFISG